MLAEQEPKKEEPGTAARAIRFPMKMPIRFRKPGEEAWRAGMTENVSRSGVLFRSNCTMKRNSELQMGFILPREVLGQAGAEVECRGRV
ncbi:MAG: PilZ domain-containing protein, partial [Candidatus Acidiferrales bacterium]